MMETFPHDCPVTGLETWVEEGRPCPNGCGWTAAWSQAIEQRLIEKARQALERYGPFVSLSEASRLSGIPLSTLAQAAREGRLAAWEILPGRWLVRMRAVEARLGLNLPGHKGRRRKNHGKINS